MARIIGIWFITVVAVVVTIFLVPGVGFTDSTYSLNAPGILGSSLLVPTLLFSAVLALINNSIKPLLKLITLPITIITLGLFALVLNVMMFYMTSWLANTFFDTGFYISGFYSALLASIIISIIVAVLGALTGLDDKKKKSQQDRRRN